jgi:threonine dehydratase
LDTRFAAARLRDVPLVRAPELDARADPSGRTRVWLALEALQVTGSFKIRGALVAVDANRARGHVVAASAGNHGLAVAYAARVLDVAATICIPRTVAQHTRAKAEKYGAELVVVASDRLEDSEALAKEIASTQGAAFISLYDDLDIVCGNGASLGFEIVRALGGVPERVLVPFGGGGLATGLAWALEAELGSTHERSVWGVQSEVSRLSAAWIEQGRLIEHPPAGQGSLARVLAEGISEHAFERALSAVAGILVATESQIAAAMVHAYRDMGLVVEGSAAAALAPVLFGLHEPQRGGDLVVVLTGRNVDPDRLEAILRRADE